MIERLSATKLDLYLHLSASVGIALFFAPVLSVPRGYTAGAIVLLLAGLISFTSRWNRELSVEDRRIIWLLVGVFAFNLASTLYHGNPLRELDLASRYLLAVPILILFIQYPPSSKVVWASVAVGSISAAGVAFWDLAVLELFRATGSTGGIQFGNIGLMLGVFSLGGAFQFWHTTYLPHRRLWIAFLIVGTIAGLFVSIASGSRGGWIALPAIGCVFLWAYTRRHNVKYVIAAILVMIVAAITAVATVPAIEARYEQALTDIELYKQGNPYTSLGQRLAMYEALAIAIPKKPWLGWSREDFSLELERLVHEEKVSDAVLRLANTHNTYLEIWVYQGLFGLGVVIVLMVILLKYFMQKLRTPSLEVRAAAVCGASLLIGYAVFSITQAMLARNNTLLFFLVGSAVFWAMIKTNATHDP